MLFEPDIFHTLTLLVVALQFLCVVVHLSFHSLPVSEGWITEQAKAHFQEEQNNYRDMQKEHKQNKQSHRGSKQHTDDTTADFFPLAGFPFQYFIRKHVL